MEVKKEDLHAEIRALHEKLDRLLVLVEARKSAKPVARPQTKPRKPKPAPLTEDEVKHLQDRFAELFVRWLEGQELEVQDELENLDVDRLRRFADANNLNVTAKMPKQRVLQLIGARFREKRQLHRGTASGGGGGLTTG
jgi:hypothetical protein